jgi:hypothetical protein
VRHEDGVTTRSVEHLGVLGPGRRYHPNGSHHRMTVLNPSNRLRPRTVRRERRNALVARGRVHSGRRTASADHRDPSSFRSRERPGADQRTTRGKQAAVMRYGYRRGSNLRRVWRCVSPGRVRGPSGPTMRPACWRLDREIRVTAVEQHSEPHVRYQAAIRLEPPVRGKPLRW